jgi:hypothetical protein
MIRIGAPAARGFTKPVFQFGVFRAGGDPAGAEHLGHGLDIGLGEWTGVKREETFFSWFAASL